MFVLGLVLACGDKEPADDSVSTDDSSAATDDSESSADGAFVATGTYDGDPFTAACQFDGTDPENTAGLQCQDGIQFFAWCRPDPDHATIGGLPPGQFQVWFNLHAAIADPGTYDLVGQTGLCVGDGLAAPLCTNSENIVSSSLTVDASTLWSAASGSFEAEWSGSDPWAGDHVASLSGTFDLTCAE